MEKSELLKILIEAISVAAIIFIFAVIMHLLTSRHRNRCAKMVDGREMFLEQKFELMKLTYKHDADSNIYMSPPQWVVLFFCEFTKEEQNYLAEKYNLDINSLLYEAIAFEELRKEYYNEK